MIQLKQKIINNFSIQAFVYDDHADVQVAAASHLAQRISGAVNELPSGPVLEIGCGTGVLTMLLLECFASRQIVVSDLSAPMLELCRQRIVRQLGQLPENVQLRLIDGETFEENSGFAAIVSSFALQWLTNIESAVTHLLNSLKPGGSFFFSVPSCQSFPEWKDLCSQANVPFTGNPLPAPHLFAESARRANCVEELYQESIAYNYPRMLDFLRCLKSLGASTSMDDNRLTINQLSRLLDQSNRSNPSGISLTYEIIFGKITKR